MSFDMDPPGIIPTDAALEKASTYVRQGPPDPRALMAEAENLVYGDRNDDYGHPHDDYSRTAGLWSALLGVEITAAQAALMMALVKFSREMNREKADNVIDAHGYLLCYGRIKRREAGLE